MFLFHLRRMARLCARAQKRRKGRELGDDAAQMLLVDLRVDLRGRKILVTKQVRNVGEAHAGHPQMRAEAVPQGMHCGLLDACLAANPLQRLEDVRVDIP